MKQKKIKMSGKVPDYKKKIADILKKRGRRPLPYKSLLKELRGSKNFNFTSFVTSLEELKKAKIIKEGGDGLELLPKPELRRARIVKLSRTFGFARLEDDETDVFISGRNLLGALPDDVVLVNVRDMGGESPEGEVVKIEEANCTLFTGQIVGDNFNLLIPDVMPQYQMIFKNPEGLKLRGGDKVLARITKRGKRHSEHKCEVVCNFGSSEKAAVCCESILAANGIAKEFDKSVLENARLAEDYGEISREAKNRRDLRNLPIFTIDSAHTKDIDDAIHIKKTKSGYELGVHIADVSHYVTEGGPLDAEAFRRGTSIYYANKVIPMLPPELSNGICSLNGGEDRLAFSCIMQVSKSGEVKSFEFSKTVIRSRVKGVYSEINELLEGSDNAELLNKYAEVKAEFPIMEELSDILEKNKISRGAPQIESTECGLLIDENDVCVGTAPVIRGKSEVIIENFMLLANECAAKFSVQNKLPFVYRVHENPDPERIENLKEVLALLGVPASFSSKPAAKDLSAALEYARGKDSAVIVNSLVLRSMAKAKYSDEPIGHFGLVLADYAHFTSPIRRYPDLAIHRIMTAFLSGTPAKEIKRRYLSFAKNAARQSSEREILSMTIERSCDDCYKAEYMKGLVGTKQEGVICSVTDFGFFVTLDNSCEGLVRLETLPEGEYSVSNLMTLRNENTGLSFTVGERVQVTVDNANVSSGKVDLSI